MKNILLIVMLSLTGLVRCQMTPNIVTETEFNDIKINNISLKDIKSTQGVRQKVRDLIPAFILEAVEDPEEDYYDYTYNGFEIGFSTKEISGFKISNNDWSVNIKGITFTIGDNISVLGNVILNTKKNGNKSIIYQYCVGCNSFIYIYFDQSNNKITEIGFIEQT